MPRHFTFYFFFVLSIFGFFQEGFSQENGFFYFSEQLDRVEIPILIRQNQLILELRINQSPPKRFLLDTGAEATLIHDAQLRPYLQKKHARTCQIGGHGPELAQTAEVFPMNTIHIGPLRGQHQTLVYLAGQDYLSPRIGIPISGVIGFHIFQSLVAELDYKRSVLILHQKDSYQASPNQVTLPLQSNHNRPFVQLGLLNAQGLPSSKRFLVDTGASLSLWLPAEMERSLATKKRGPAYIGTGIYGPIKGQKAELPLVQIGPLKMHNVPVFSSPSQIVSTQTHQDYGILGNDFLKNFRVIMNYPQKQISLLPLPENQANWHFSHNTSGLEIMAPRPGVREYFVDFVLPLSPSEKAGIQAGDQLLAINGIPVNQYSLDRVIRLILGDGGHLLYLTLKKGRKTYTTQLRIR